MDVFLVVGDEGSYCPSGKVLCIPKILVSTCIPYMFVYWANPVGHLLLLKSSMGKMTKNYSFLLFKCSNIQIFRELCHLSDVVKAFLSSFLSYLNNVVRFCCCLCVCVWHSNFLTSIESTKSGNHQHKKPGRYKKQNKCCFCNTTTYFCCQLVNPKKPAVRASVNV